MHESSRAFAYCRVCMVKELFLGMVEILNVCMCVSCAPDPCGVSKSILPHRLGDGSNLEPCPRIRGPFGVRSRGVSLRPLHGRS